MDESENELNQLLTTGGDMQNKLANPILLMSAPDSVALDAESSVNTANITLMTEEASPAKLILKDEKPTKDKK